VIALNQSRPERSAICAAETPHGYPSSHFAPFLLTPLVLLVHGYHPFASDAGIYVAGIRHILDSSLYPLNAVFPAAFVRLSLFPWILAALVGVSHLPLDWVLFAAYLLSILLFLIACHQLAVRLFKDESVRWCALLLAAACFTLPVAGTALFVMDPYVTARSFSTPLSLLAVAASMDRAWPRAIFLLALAALIHPLMAAFAIAFVILYSLVAGHRARLAAVFCCAAILVCGGVFLLAHWTPISPAYREAVSLPQRSFLFLARWRGYEIFGLLAPLALLALALRKLRSATRAGALCLACPMLGATSILVAAFFVPPAGPYALVPLQVLRVFHLIYMLGIVLAGGVLARLGSRSPAAVAFLIFVLFAGMFCAERIWWPGSARLEWPRSHPANSYQQAFLWIRDHTPRDAIFAFNPQLVYQAGEDEQGFRAIAERDHLADDKDAGVVAVLPRLADRWALQRNAQAGVDSMSDADRVTRLTHLGANWLLLGPQDATGFPCPYINGVVKVCQMARQEQPR
jgi:hypothetical protein